MNVIKYDIITEQERWMEGNIEGQISDIQYGEASASEGAHSSCTKAFVWIGLCYFPPSRVVKIPVVIAAV